MWTLQIKYSIHFISVSPKDPGNCSLIRFLRHSMFYDEETQDRKEMESDKNSTFLELFYKIVVGSIG